MTPNKPKTPTSTFRIPARVKEAAQLKAAEEGRTLTEVIVDYLKDYIRA